MGMTLAVARGVIEALLGEAERAAPDECCGLLLGEGAIESMIPAVNVADYPRRRFEIDPAVLIAAHKAERVGGPKLAGYYHSHPAGPPEPSVADAAQAARDGRVWAIVGQTATAREVRFWRDGPEGFEALSYTLAPG